jgi:predicted ATPase
VESRFEALHASGLTELVGREEELELLLRRWSKAKAGEGQVVLLSGEAGIGKSRLTAALMERLEGEPHTRLRYFCSPQHTDSALYPVIGQMERQPPALGSALDRLIAAGLLFRQGVPPHASYLFKHTLVQDAAYGTLLREPRRALHARIAETLETQFLEVAENQPELLARHCTEAGLIEKAAGLWGKAGQRSLTRSALVEAAEQLARAIDQIATLQATPASRREQISLQVALITPLIHVKGYAAPETKKALEQARFLIEQAEALGERPEDPLLLFSVLFGIWATHRVAFNGDALLELATQYLVL